MVNEVLEVLGKTGGWEILKCLYSNSKTPKTHPQVRELAGVNNATANRRLKELTETGLLNSKTEPQNGRTVTLYSINKKGEDVVSHIFKIAERWGYVEQCRT